MEEHKGGKPSELGGKRSIDPVALDTVRDLYQQFFNQEIMVVEMIADQEIPNPTDNDFYKKITFRGNALRTQMNVVKECARGITKEMREGGDNKEEDKINTHNIMKLVEERLKNDGVDVKKSIKETNEAERKERGRRISVAKKENNAKKVKELEDKQIKRDSQIERNSK